MKKKLFTGIIYAVAYLYFLPMIISVPYYNWTYARENGFGKWLAFGEFVATGKGIIWPYYFFSKKTEESSFEHLTKSIEYANQTASIVNVNHPFVSLDASEKKKFIDFKRQALVEALLVKTDTLNSRHPNFGNYFRDDYLKGLHLLIDGYNKNSDKDIVQAFSLLGTWADWYSANHENIQVGNKIEVKAIQDESTIVEAPQMTANELDRYSLVLKKADKEALNESDITELRSIFKEYSGRTGGRFSSEEYNYFIGTTKMSDDYLYELGTSLLLSWDQKKKNTTAKFDELYQTMKTQKLRNDEMLKMDIETLKAAAANQNFVEDLEGRKFTFSRDVILAHMKNNEVTNNNIQKIADLIKEFMN